MRTQVNGRPKRVLVLGASGGVGGFAVRFAAERGHHVTAVARGELAVPAGVSLLRGDVTQPDVIDRAVRGQDVVLSALGIRRRNHQNPWSPLASPADFTEATARSLVAAMREHRVPRVIAVSAAGVGESASGLNLMMRFMIRFTNVGANYRDLDRMEAVYRESGLDWCCVRPTGLKDGPATGSVASIPDFPFNAWISRADVAKWMVDHLETDLSQARTPIITEARS